MSLTQPTGSANGMAQGAVDPTTGQQLNAVPGTTQPAAAGATSAATVTVFGFLLAWLIVILVLWAVARTRTGYSLLYYSAVAALVLMLLTQYRWVIAAVYPVTGAVVSLPHQVGSANDAGQ